MILKLETILNELRFTNLQLTMSLNPSDIETSHTDTGCLIPGSILSLNTAGIPITIPLTHWDHHPLLGAIQGESLFRKYLPMMSYLLNL